MRQDPRTNVDVPDTYEPVVDWGKLPDSMTFNGDANSLAVDSQDRIFVFNRGPLPIIVFDPEGNVLGAWGEGEFSVPHAITIDAADNLYLVDRGHFVQKRTPDGEVLFTLGSPGNPSPAHSGEPFNQPTDVAVDPETGDLFVTDGYKNSRVHRFSSEGHYMMSWGESGGDPGQFSLPHGICIIGDRIVVSDRENFRLQTFTLQGEFLEQWHVYHPLGIYADTRLQVIYVTEMGPEPIQEGVPRLGNRVSVFNWQGRPLTAFGAPLPGQGPDQFICPHSVASDSEGNLYIAEVSASFLASSHSTRQETVEEGAELISLRKWRPVR